MPSVSGKQKRAFAAAAHGASKFGIPKQVGEEFAEADKRKDSPGEEKTEKVKKPKKAPPVRGGPFSLRR